jgi:hypothetical protein
MSTLQEREQMELLLRTLGRIADALERAHPAPYVVVCRNIENDRGEAE